MISTVSVWRYPWLCLLVTGGLTLFSFLILVVAFLSKPLFDTGGVEAHERVKSM